MELLKENNVFQSLLGIPTDLNDADLRQALFDGAALEKTVKFAGAIFSSHAPPKPKTTAVKGAAWKQHVGSGGYEAVKVMAADEEEEEEDDDDEEEEDGRERRRRRMALRPVAVLYARARAFTASGAYLLLKLDAKRSALPRCIPRRGGGGRPAEWHPAARVQTEGSRRRAGSRCSSISVWLRVLFDELLPRLLDELEAELGLRAPVKASGGTGRSAARVHPTQREPDLEAGGGSKGGGEEREARRRRS